MLNDANPFHLKYFLDRSLVIKIGICCLIIEVILCTTGACIARDVIHTLRKSSLIKMFRKVVPHVIVQLKIDRQQK